jgi:hypothetical protein
MAPIRAGVHIMGPAYIGAAREGKSLHEFDALNQSAAQMLEQLMWWVAALKTAREKR